MRVLFTTWSAPAHWAAMAPLAVAVRAAGHGCLVVAPPECGTEVRAAGLGFAPAGRPVTGGPPGDVPGPWPPDWPLRVAALPEPHRRFLRAFAARQVAIAEAMLPDLLALAADWRPDLVVSDGSTHAGKVLASVRGVPHVQHQWGAPAIVSTEHSPDHARLLGAYGVDPLRRPDLLLDPCPPSLRLPGADPSGAGPSGAVPRQSIRHSAAGPADRAGAAVVGLHGAGGWSAQVHEALRDVDLLVSPTAADLLRCRVVVHRGFGPTTLVAAAAGIPQVVLSTRPEQLVTGHRLAALGTGVHFLDPAPGGGRPALADAIERMQAEPARRAARRLRAEIDRLPAPAEIVTLLERLQAGRPYRAAHSA